MKPLESLSRRLRHVAGPALLGLAAGAANAADDAALQRCRAIAEPAARLACYDALPLRVAAPTPAAMATPAPSAAASAAQTFGQPRTDEPNAITSHIPGRFEGWGPRTRITLANGQVWQVTDDSTGVYALQDPKVTVRRAFMGGFSMDIAGANRVPRVRRVD